MLTAMPAHHGRCLTRIQPVGMEAVAVPTDFVVQYLDLAVSAVAVDHLHLAMC